MIRHQRGRCIVPPLLSLELAAPENILTRSVCCAECGRQQAARIAWGCLSTAGGVDGVHAQLVARVTLRYGFVCIWVVCRSVFFKTRLFFVEQWYTLTPLEPQSRFGDKLLEN